MRENKINNNCMNCASCVKLYANLRGEYFVVTGRCYCNNTNLTKRESIKRMDNLVACEYWQPKEIQINKRKKCIKEMLYDIANKLEDVASILKEDNETNE